MKKISLLLLLVAGVGLLSACGTKPESPENYTPTVGNQKINDGNYSVNINSSKLAWQAAKVKISHTGLVAIKSGEINILDGAITSGNFVIDMPTISSDENIDSLVKHLKSADFFDVENYPEARLEIKSATLDAQSGNYLVSGDLTIREITAPVSFLAQVNSGDNYLEANGDLVIDRLTWGIKYGSGKFFDDLGDAMIDDEIKFTVAIRAEK